MEVNFTKGKILAPLIKFSLPIFLALFLQAMYGAIDLIIVGQFGDVSGVSAVATGSQIMQTITGIVTGLTMGTTIFLGQKIGQEDYEGAGKVIGTAVYLFGIVSILITVLMFLLANPFTKLMHAPIEAFDKTLSYVFVCSSGVIFIVAYNVISGIFRGIGNSKLPLIFVSIACIVNILGDLLFVAVLKLDSTGAAMATVLAQAVSVVLSVLIIKKQKLPFSFTRKSISFRKKEIGRMLGLGFPIALQDFLTNISFLIITAILNTMGVIASAGVGVAEKVVVFIMLIPISYMSSISAFVAQNIGAKEIDRAKKAMIYGMISSLIVGIIMFYIGFFHGEILTSIFSKDRDVVLAGANYLKSYSIDCILVSILFCFMGYFNGCGRTIFVLIAQVSSAFLIRIPFSYFISKVEGVTMFEIGLANPISTVVGVIICLIYYKKSIWSKRSNGI